MTGSRSAASTQRAARSGACVRSWPCSRTGNWQAIADIGQVIFEIAVFVRLRLERDAADLAVAGGETPAGRAHAAPFRPVDRHCVQDSQRGRQHLGADALAGALHMAGRAGEVELAAPRVEIALALLKGF